MNKTSLHGIQVIKDFEGFRAKPYLCQAGVPTIGYGSTFYPNGRKVSLQDASISEHAASVMLEQIVERFERDVTSLVKVALTQNQFDALVSFCFNVGAKALGGSTLLRKINLGDYAGAAEEFIKWNKVGGKANKGLTRRRAIERALFLGEI